MKRNIGGLLAASLLVLAGCAPGIGLPANQETSAEASDTGDDRYGPIPGPRSCFWSRGPHSGDPYINVAYPDSNVFYWAAVFSIPEGARLTLEGDYPHSRYMSFISYDERGRPVESLADYLIEPGPSMPGPKLGALEGDARLVRFTEGEDHIEAGADPTAELVQSVNPFVSGNRRDSEHRRYEVEIANEAPSARRKTGERAGSQSGNLLHAPAYGPGQQVVLYRIYLPDDGLAPDGGVSLPRPVVTLADGTQLLDDEACASLKTRQQLAISLDAVGIPADEYRELITLPGKPDTWPAQNPANWFIQLDRKSLIGMYTGDIDPDAPRSEGGFYPNLDNHYIRAIINRKHGKVLIVRGKAPTTPKTHGGEAVMGDGQLRYWSLCSNQSFANTRVNDCVFDEEIPVGPDGMYTIAISRVGDRPRNATPECGLAWLPMAEDGDGVFDEDTTIIQYRHMLTAPDFPNSIQRVFKQEDLESTMGPYMPRTRYLMPNQVESFFPCAPRPGAN